MNDKTSELVNIAHAIAELNGTLKDMCIYRNKLVSQSNEDTEWNWLQDPIDKINEIYKTLIDEAYEIALAVKSDRTSKE